MGAANHTQVVIYGGIYWRVGQALFIWRLENIDKGEMKKLDFQLLYKYDLRRLKLHSITSKLYRIKEKGQGLAKQIL